ncbi:hypothetical protein IJ11_0004075 [Lacticaseibacillus paracasei]|nr:hypothetical protein IJ11_0004075 [Lacticaseibacillus paracasei]
MNHIKDGMHMLVVSLATFVSVYLLVVMTASIEMSFMRRWFLFFVVGGSSAGIASFFYELLSGESVD